MNIALGIQVSEKSDHCDLNQVSADISPARIEPRLPHCYHSQTIPHPQGEKHTYRSRKILSCEL